MPLYVCSLPNPGEPGVPHECIADDPRVIEAFAQREDKPGRGVYDCVSPLKPGARRRALDTVGEVVALHVDIDSKDIADDMATVDARLASLMLSPTEVRNSGHGRHVRFELKEPIAASDSAEVARATAVLKELTTHLCGDMAVAHYAALLRRPGTHNSKGNAWLPVGHVMLTGARYDLGDIEDWLGDVDGRTLFTRKSAGNGHDKSVGADASGKYKPPIDVEARLAAMRHLGAGDSSIHLTQLSTTASLLRQGVSLLETTRTVLDATRAAAGNDARWDWRREELGILRMGCDFIVKRPELVTLLPDQWRQRFEEALAQGRRPDIGFNTGGFYVRACKVAPAETEASSKREIIKQLLLKGTTLAEVCKAVGWERVSLQRYARLSGLTLTKYQEGGVTKYKGVAEDPAAEEKPAAADNGEATPPRGWRFYDSATVSPIRWLVKQLLPETGVGIMSGQWGSFKTTAALDLSVSVMTGQPFAGQYRIKRKGAVLYFATEGAGTLQSRLAAIARHRGAPEKLPFAWRGDCPLLTDRDAGKAITKYVDEAAVHFEHAYGVAITLIWVDTYITAAGLSSSGDDNDTAATQKAFNTLRFVAAHSGAFVATIDHLGKVVEAGTRGSSGKEGNADTVLATLAEREITGAVSNSRMAARKQRDGVSGFEVPFTPETVELGLDEDGDAITAIILSWGKQQREPVKRARQSKDRDLLAHTLMDVVAKRGFAFVPDPGGPSVRACHGSVLRAEFYERRPAKGTTKQRADTCRRAFERALENARATGLVGVREAGGEEVVWARQG